MFCYQCEQTKRNDAIAGCASQQGTCGKNEITSDLQDILVYLLQGVAQYHYRLAKLKGVDNQAAEFTLYGLFTTLTNVNFNATRFNVMIKEATTLRDRLKAEYEALEPNHAPLNPAASFIPANSPAELLQQASIASVKAGEETVGADVIGLRVLILYGLKGVAAYAYHAWVLGFKDDKINLEMARLLDYLATSPTDIEELLQQALAVGELNLQVMALLEKANTDSFGAQTVTQVRITPVAGKAILVSGHDLHDLHQILEQTSGKNINVYTHGEMLPAHAYGKLKAYPHLVGNYGGAWQNQQQEFADFPGAIIVTSNCLVEPQVSYRQRIFTAGPVGWSGVRHIQDGNFAPAIQAAAALAGFKETEAEKTITVGFGRHTLLGAAETVVNAVKQGAIKHFFLIGGCDGAVPGRNYYTELAEQTPENTVIMTLGCGKYRFNKQDFGTIGGLPRLLDIGQCNDAYVAIEIAKALAGAFNCGVNDLPLSLMVSWFEQKATAVFLSLLALNVKNIHLGPSLPAYLTPNLLAVLQERFAVKANKTAQLDLAEALAA
ncbi:hydroxylamine reductase [Beggiatoa alba B18LD]|uniref:Hydroxylamine reductase n=1 Tax=Beggiatoa alba B18LD TaxID=395493 RepID=I3CH38_9GAMM|nr:hydroxylamine reductase [Beggiatoa alba]EIJ42931.1 hydroxylamine reductase [Beggiatoa alba B18LD]